MTIMGKRKRKLEENVEKEEAEIPPVKKTNVDKPEQESTETPATENAENSKSKPKFDIKHFRKDLNKVSSRLVGLTQFLHACTHSDGSVDYITKYLESGGSPGEILKQLEGASQKDALLASTVFNLFHLMIDKIQSSIGHLLQSAEDTCRYFLNTYVSTIDTMLGEKSNAKQQRATLKLLTSIVSLNPELGLTILNQLSLQPKTLGHLVRHSVKAKDDVRTSFIQFLMSFFIDGNGTLIKTVLNKQGLLAMIIPDLIRDKASVVLTVLQLIKNSILNNAIISKTLKFHTFSHHVISCIFNLFNWGKRASKSKELVESDVIEVEKAVDEVLVLIFTSHKYGLYFIDKTLGTSDVPKNRYLWKVIESLEAPWNNEKAGECLTRILSNSPDLYKPIKTIVEESFDPKQPEQCFKTVNFLKIVMKAIDPKSIIKMIAEIDPTNLINYIKNVYLPISILKTSTAVLKSTNDVMKNDIIILLHTMLSCVREYFNVVSADDPSFKKIRNILKNRLAEFIPKFFPTVDLLVLTMHTVLSEVSSVGKKERTEEEKEQKSKLIIHILDLLLLYNDIVPDSFDPVLTTLDTIRLFEKIECLPDVHKTELKLKTTTFLLCADRLAFAPDKPLFKEILFGMLEVLISDNVDSADAAHNVLYGILDTTGIFEGNKTEINILLYVVRTLFKKYGESISSMVVSLIEDIISNHEKYNKELSKFTLNAGYVDERLRDNFEIIFNNLENYSKDNKELYFIEDRPIFTCFVIGLLKNLKKYVGINEGAKSFSNQFVTLLLHFQDNPTKYFDVLETFKDELTVEDYVLSWKNEPVCIEKKLFSKKSCIYKLSMALLSDSVIDVAEVFNLKSSEESTEDERCIKLNDVTFSIENLSVNPSELLILSNMVLFYVVQQYKLDTLNETKLLNAKTALFCIFEISLICDKHVKRLFVDIVKRCLGNGDLLQDFAPFENRLSHLTQFVLDIVTYCSDKPVEREIMEAVIKPFKHKIYLILTNEIQQDKLKNKGVKFDKIEEVLSLLNLDFADSLSLLSEIVKLDVHCMVTDANEASTWVFVICHIFDLHIKNCVALSLNIFIEVMALYSKIINDLSSVLNISELEKCLYEYLLINPSFIEKVPSDVFETTFGDRHISKYTSKLSGLLLQSNSNKLPIFIKYSVKEDVLSKREFIIPLTLAAFQHSKFQYSTDVLNTIYNYYKPNITKIIEKPQKATQIYIDNVDFIIKLIYYCMDVNECETFLKKVHKFDSAEIFHMNVIEAIFYKFALTDRSKINLKYLENFILTILQLSTVALKRDDPQEDKILKISSALNSLILLATDNNSQDSETKLDLSAISKNAIWQNSFKTSLKVLLKPGDHTRSSNLIGNICRLIDIIYPEDHSDIVEFFEMATSHSEFLNVMLNVQFSNVKTQLAQLLHTLVCKNKSVMKVSHIPVYFSAYQATMNDSDRTLLSLLKLYENNGHSMTEYRPYLWSDIGANYFALRSNRKKASLWSNPTANHVLNLLDKEVIEKTIKYFPVDIELNSDIFSHTFNDIKSENELIEIIDDTLNINNEKYGKDVEKVLSLKLKLPKYKLCLSEITRKDFSNKLFSTMNSEIYDPVFLLSLLNFIVAPGSAVSCHHILRGGILAVPLMALSSHCPLVRSASYNILYRFYSQLESEMYYKNDKLLWTQFLDTIRCSLNTAIVDTENGTTDINVKSSPRLPSVCALYLARAALVMTNPLDPLFKPINNFVILKQHINFSVVPDLLDLFHNTDITYAERRIWILKVLRDGVKTFDDIKILLKSVTFKILLDFYSCSLCDAKTKLLILEILNVSVKIPRAVKILVEGYGLFPWLNTTFKSISNENKDFLSKGITLVHSILIAMTMETTSKILDGKGKNSLNLLLSGKCFKLSETLQCEVLYLVVGLLDKLLMVNIDDIIVYFKVLKKLSSSVLKQITQVQMLKLVRECDHVVNPVQKCCKTVSLAITSKNIGLLSTSLMILNRTSAPTEKEVALKYLHEIVLTWMS